MASTAITPLTVEPASFARKVIEDRLRVEGPIQGYLYAERPGVKDAPLYRTYASKKWVYQARRINTQDNVAGGSLTTRIGLSTGQIAKIIAMEVVGSASVGATLTGLKVDEDGATVARIIGIAAAANLAGHVPNIGTVANATNNFTDSRGMLLLPGSYLVLTSNVALQTQMLTVGIELEIYNLPTLPVWDTAGSAGTPNLADSTISDANTLQELVC